MDYYGDNNAHACQWVRELIAAGLVPEGDVDERDIREVRPADLVGYERVHHFAGVCGWEIIGETEGGKLALGLRPERMPPPCPPVGFQPALW